MKKRITKFLTPALLAFASLALFASSAKAYTYSDGDLFLGFYDPTGNSTKDYLLYIGNYSNYTTNGGAFTGSSFSLNTGIGIGTAAQINADLTTAFGAGWFGTVEWGVVGVQNRNHTNTLFATDPGATSTSVAWTSDTASNQGVTGLDISNLGAVFASNGRGGATAANGSIQLNTKSGSYYDYSPLGTVSTGASFDNFTGGIDSTSSSAYLTELIATDASAHGTALGANGSDIVTGQFTLGSDGSINYITTAAVPEPSTYAMAGLGAVFLVMAARRRQMQKA